MKETLIVTTPSDREVAMTRVFNAPRALVFRAFTEPALLKRWLFGPPEWSLAVCEVDLRVGGKIRYLWRKPGVDMGMSGVFREVVPPERLVHTEIFDEDWTGGEALFTTTFTERAGKTTVVMTGLYSSREARDGAVHSGMAEGVEMGYARLDELFPTLL